MDAKDATAAIRGWLDDENLEYRVVDDGKATLHLHVKYPPTKDGHVFNIVIPKKRLLVLVYSITRVDQGQQDEMVSYREEDLIGWKGWLHEIRMHLTRSTLDWVLHVGKEDEQNKHSNHGLAPPLHPPEVHRNVGAHKLVERVKCPVAAPIPATHLP